MGSVPALAIVSPSPDSAPDLPAYAREHRQSLLEALDSGRVVLFRGFPGMTREDFQATAEALTGKAIEYEYRSNQRTRLSGRVFNSTDFPATEPIHFHNEMSYFSKWPKHVWFHCEQPAVSGGRTVLADAARVYASLDREIVEKFERLGVRYVRNLTPGLDVPWQVVFDTENKESVEQYCAENDISCEWRDSDTLRTVQHRPATATERRTGDRVWFNQAHLFHPSSLGNDVYRLLSRTYPPEELPRTATYGDGQPIPVEVLDEIRRVYAAGSIPIDWAADDVVAFDNVKFAHSREPFVPPRNLSVALTGDGRESVA